MPVFQAHLSAFLKILYIKRKNTHKKNGTQSPAFILIILSLYIVPFSHRVLLLFVTPIKPCLRLLEKGDRLRWMRTKKPIIPLCNFFHGKPIHSHPETRPLHCLRRIQARSAAIQIIAFDFTKHKKSPSISRLSPLFAIK